MTNEEKILEILTGIQDRMDGMQNRIDGIQDRMDGMQNRIDGIQDRMDEMQDVLTKVAVTQEGVILPKLQLLYEGQVNLQQTLAPKERVEVLEDEVLTLKTAVKTISKRLAALEKAQ